MQKVYFPGIARVKVKHYYLNKEMVGKKTYKGISLRFIELSVCGTLVGEVDGKTFKLELKLLLRTNIKTAGNVKRKLLYHRKKYH